MSKPRKVAKSNTTVSKRDTKRAAGDEDLLCSVCLQPYNVPKTLPCLHTFCQSCLESHIKKIDEEGDLEEEFPCPLCWKPTITLAKSEPPIAWAQYFPDATFQVGNETSRNANKRFCDPCLNGTKATKPAFKSCVVCNEDLCKECVAYHSRFKATKHHQLVGTEEAYGADGALEDEQKCNQHVTEPIKYYCRTDNKLCCSRCVIVNHRVCKGVLDLKTVAKGLKEDPRSKRLNSKITTLKHYLEKMADLVQENTKSLEKQVKDVPDRIKSVRLKINELLDNIEKGANLIAKKLYDEEAQRNWELLTQFKRLSAAVKTSDKVFNAALKGAESQLYVTMFKLEDQILAYEEMVKAEHDKVLPLSLEFQIEDKIDPLLASSDELVDVRLEQAIQELPQLPVVRPLKDCEVEHCFVVEVKAEREFPPRYSGALCLPGGQILLTDAENDKLLLLDSSWKCVSDLTFQSSPWKVAFAGKDKVIVNLRYERQFAVINVTPEKLSLDRHIASKRASQCIATIDDLRLAVVWNEGKVDAKTDQDKFSFGIITLTGDEKAYFDKDSNGREFKGFWHMAVDTNKNRVLQPCIKEDALFCFDLDGHHLFRYKSKDLRQPGGVDFDADGNIYVCGSMSKNIHQISPEGMLLDIISSTSLRDPFNICFFPDKLEFFVTSHHKRDTLHKFRFLP